MTSVSFNCLPEGTSLDALIRRERVTGVNLRFCRTVASLGEKHETITCAPREAEFTTLYAVTELGPVIAIHDVDLTNAGADEVAAVARALFLAILNVRGDVRA